MLPIGIEIGSSSVKAVELVKEGQNFFLSSYSLFPAPAKALSSDSETDFVVLIEAVKKTYGALKTRNRIVAMAIDQSLVFTRILEMPQMTDPELASAINWESEEYIPIPLDQARLEWQVMRRYVTSTGEKRMDVLLMAVARTLIDKYHRMAAACGLELKILEPESLAIMRTLSLFNLNVENCLIVNFGETKTDILISANSAVSFVRSVSTGGKALTRVLATELNLNEDQAENYKLAYGFDRTKLNGSIAAIMQPVMDVVIEEIRHALAFQLNKDPKNPLRMLLACGAGSNLPDINVLLSKSLNVEVITADPFSVLKTRNKNLRIANEANQKFLVATGLSMNII